MNPCSSPVSLDLVICDFDIKYTLLFIGKIRSFDCFFKLVTSSSIILFFVFTCISFKKLENTISFFLFIKIIKSRSKFSIVDESAKLLVIYCKFLF